MNAPKPRHLGIVTEPTDCTETSSTYEVEFRTTQQAKDVMALISGGKTFQEAVDWLELRPNHHFIVTKVEGNQGD